MDLSAFQINFSKKSNSERNPQRTTQPSNKLNIHKREIFSYLENWESFSYPQNEL